MFRPDPVQHGYRKNQLKIDYRELTPQDFLQTIEARNLEKYQNTLGPTADQLHSSGKSWMDIIKGAAKPDGKDLNFQPPGFGGK